MFNKIRAKIKIDYLNRKLINKIYQCKEELDKNSDIPISWQLQTLGDIWHPELKGSIGTNGRPEVMFKWFAIEIQTCNDVEEFAKSLPEWQVYKDKI